MSRSGPSPLPGMRPAGRPAEVMLPSQGSLSRWPCSEARWKRGSASGLTARPSRSELQRLAASNPSTAFHTYRSAYGGRTRGRGFSTAHSQWRSRCPIVISWRRHCSWTPKPEGRDAVGPALVDARGAYATWRNDGVTVRGFSRCGPTVTVASATIPSVTEVLP